MTATVMKNEARRMLDAMDDEQLMAVFDFLRQKFEQKRGEDAERSRKAAAFERAMKLSRRVDLPQDFDYKKELGKILAERYDSLG